MANFETIRLDKGLYSSRKGFTAELESVDPSENYKGTALEGLDAFERQLKRFDIKIHGAASDCVEKFFQTSDSAALFPEYVARAVRKGQEEADLLPYIVACRPNPKKNCRKPKRVLRFPKPTSTPRKIWYSSKSAAECWLRLTKLCASSGLTCSR